MVSAYCNRKPVHAKHLLLLTPGWLWSGSRCHFYWWLRHYVFRSSATPTAEVIAPRDQADPELIPVIRYGRYTLVELSPGSAQRDLLLQVIDVRMPDEAKLVLAMAYATFSTAVATKCVRRDQPPLNSTRCQCPPPICNWAL